MPRRLCFIIFSLGIILSLDVLAHAEMLDTVPNNGAVMAEAPAEFLIRFSEPVSIIRVQLLNRQRQTITLGEVLNIDSELRFKPLTALEEGQYLMSYRVLSLDAHPVSGSVGFAVGNLPAPMPVFTEVDSLALFIARLNRSIHLVAILACMGMVLFPLIFTLAEELEPKRQRYLNYATVVGILSAIFGLGLWGVLLKETALITVLEADTWSVAMSTSLGTSFALVVAGLTGILTANLLDPRLPPGRFSGLLGVLLLVVSFGASGHAATGGLLLTSIFVVHASMAGLWFGALWLIYRSVMLEPATRATAILNQFSWRVTGIVTVLLGCALILIWYQLGAWAEFIRSDYGNWLMLKLGLVSLVLILAALNRWRLTPTIQKSDVSARQSLRRSVFIEGLLMIAVIGVTTILASTPPPAKKTSATSQSVNLMAGDQIGLDLSLAPARTGINTIDLVFTREGESITPLEVNLYWLQEEAGIEALSRPARVSEAGSYQIDDLELLVEGEWQFRVEALIDDFTRERFEVNIQIN